MLLLICLSYYNLHSYNLQEYCIVTLPLSIIYSVDKTITVSVKGLLPPYNFNLVDLQLETVRKIVMKDNSSQIHNRLYFFGEMA